MPYDALEPARTGLLFFDMLNHSVEIMEQAWAANEPGTPRQSMRSVVANAARLRAAADAAGIPVLFAKGDHRADGMDGARLYSDTDLFLRPLEDPENDRFEGRKFFTSSTHGSDPVPELGLTQDDYLIPKLRWSAFYQTKLELSLRARGIDTLIVSGAAMEVGIVSTCYAARDRDFNLVLVRDACAALEADVGDMMFEHLFPRFARIRSTDETLALIQAGLHQHR